MKGNQKDNNEEYENQINRKSMYTRKTIVLILVAVIAGLGLVAAIVLISIEFNQIHRLSNEASEFAFRTTNAVNSTTLVTIKHTFYNTDTYSSSSTKLSTTTPVTTTTQTLTTTTIMTTIRTVSTNITTTLIAIGNASVYTN